MRKKKYCLYAWRTDNEGGISICNTEDFSPFLDYEPESGWRAEYSKAIGYFDNEEQLSILLSEEYSISIDKALVEAREMIEWFEEMQEED